MIWERMNNNWSNAKQITKFAILILTIIFIPSFPNTFASAQLFDP